MKRRTVFALGLAAGLLAVPAPFGLAQGAPREGRGAPADRQAPWLGIWRLQPPKSTSRFNPPPYKKVTSRIEPWEDGLKVVYDMVRTRGGITHMEWTGRFDGRDYPVQGAGYFLTNAYRLIDDRSYEIIIKVDGTVAATARAVVSPDGGTLRVTTVEKDPRGQTVETTAVYEKQ